MTASANLLALDETRRLGPAAVGKIASGAFWYIYFVKEQGHWKVWRMEYALLH